jgi:hypothetical protein
VRGGADQLQQVFVSFSLFGKGILEPGMRAKDVRMDSKAFAKLMKEAGVMEGRLNLTRVDLCYAKCCDKARPPSCLSCFAWLSFGRTLHQVEFDGKGEQQPEVRALRCGGILQLAAAPVIAVWLEARCD